MDGEWKENPEDLSTPDDNGNINNYIDTTPRFEEKMRKSKIEKVTKKNFDPIERRKQTSRKEFIFDPEAPELPPHFQTVMFLNKQEVKMQKIKEMNKLKDSSTPARSIVKILDETLAPPTHVELNHIGQKIEAKNPGRGRYKVYTTTTRYKAKYSTMKLYLK